MNLIKKKMLAVSESLAVPNTPSPTQNYSDLLNAMSRKYSPQKKESIKVIALLELARCALEAGHSTDFSKYLIFLAFDRNFPNYQTCT